MTKYSIAIRTLGTSGKKFVRELESRIRLGQERHDEPASASL